MTSYEYDGLGRVTSISAQYGSISQTEEKGYTLTGKLSYISNANYRADYQYDQLGNRVSEERFDGTRFESSYDTENNRISLTTYQNNSTIESVTYSYDKMNRMKSVYENNAFVAEYGYDANGNRVSLSYANGVQTTYTYNYANLITSLENTNGTELLSRYDYTYYLDGNQATKTENSGKTTSYIYDDLGRLEREIESAAVSATTKAYTYDAAGNRSLMSVSGVQTYNIRYEYDLNNRLITEEELSDTGRCRRYMYDSNGNTTSVAAGTLDSSFDDLINERDINITIYTYDGFNRLVKAESSQGISEYGYGPDGLRSFMTINGERTDHIWEGNRLVMEVKDSEIYNSYLYGNGLISSMKNGFYLFNAHGDVVQLTGSTGSISRDYCYDAFGVETNMDDQDTNPFRYCGEYFDISSGTYYMRARYYDPTIGRFLAEDTHWNPTNMIYGDNPVKWNEQPVDSNDPLGLSTYTYVPDITAIMQSGNRYVYSINNPVMYRDSDGESITLTCIIIGAAIGGIVNSGFNIYAQIQKGYYLQNINWASAGVSFVAGAMSGGIAGSPIGLLGQVGFNAVISGTESVLQDKLYGRNIDWVSMGTSAGIGGLAGLVGGKGAMTPSKTVYGKILGTGGINTSVVYLTYTSRIKAEAAGKALFKGLTRSVATQIIVTDNVVKVMYEE